MCIRTPIAHAPSREASRKGRGRRVPATQVARLLQNYQPPGLVVQAGAFAQYAYAEFFSAEIGSDGTRQKYRYNVDRFLGWLERQGIGWREVSAPVVSEYIREQPRRISSSSSIWNST